jgi:NLI interacting factor-like phosphatase
MHEKKANILLDLDHTLISAEATEEYDISKNKEKAKKFTFHDMDGYYIVFERPGLQKFLDYLFDNFNVSVWTAASKDYALFVIEKIVLAGKENRHIDYVFFSYHCDISKNKKKTSKNLKMLWEEYKLPGYNENNTLILDDYKEDVYDPQKENCILAKPFEFTKINTPDDDTFLLDLIEKLKKMSENVRTTVKEINATP